MCLSTPRTMQLKMLKGADRSPRHPSLAHELSAGHNTILFQTQGDTIDPTDAGHAVLVSEQSQQLQTEGSMGMKESDW